MKRLVLLDIDGTILSTGGSGRDAMESALMQVFGTTGDPRFRYDGKTDRQIVRELMLGAGFDADDIDERMSSVIQSYVDGLRRELQRPGREIGTYPGVESLMDAVEASSDDVLGLLTGNVQQGARLKLESVGLEFDRFRVNAFGSDHEVRSQLPAIAWQRMCDAYGVSLAGRDVVVIGDTPADIECGRELGARVIAVATGRYSVPELREHHPYAVFSDLADTGAVMEVIQA